MKTFIRSAFILFALGSGAAAHAQMTFKVEHPVQVGGDSNVWKYSEATCVSQNPITSIIVSMYNNEVQSISGTTPTHTIESEGKNPQTILYLFTPSLTTAETETFIKGITFKKTDAAGANIQHIANISVDANPTSLPLDGTKITVWNEHPDGSTHYYLWVPDPLVTFHAAYRKAKTYYFQGMRGYLPTVTSYEENQLLINISNEEGWSGGARTRHIIADTRNEIQRPAINDQTPWDRNYRWVCGPETDFFYYNGPMNWSPDAGPANKAFSGWRPGEPNGAAAFGGENCMQLNQPEGKNRYWNDYSPVHESIKGYFIEFGGNGKAYSVTSGSGTANYPANTKYKTPTVTTDNDQWFRYSPGNEASTSTVIKRKSIVVRAMLLD